MPVLVGDWPEKAEATILATLDPVGAMAEGQREAFDELTRDLLTDSIWRPGHDDDQNQMLRARVGTGPRDGEMAWRRTDDDSGVVEQPTADQEAAYVADLNAAIEAISYDDGSVWGCGRVYDVDEYNAVHAAVDARHGGVSLWLHAHDTLATALADCTGA